VPAARVRPGQMTTPLFDTDSMISPLRAQITARVAAVIEAGRFVLGPAVTSFERELAAYLGVRSVVAVANGTDAITIALRALGIRPDDEVVVPSFTFYASAEAVVTAGARPVFCDVDPDTRNVTADTVKAALTARCRAVLAVDLFGNPAPVPEIKRLGLPVLEDAAQAAGAGLPDGRAGALGDVATLSFYPSKNLPCFGDGGAIMSDDEGIAERARMLRFHGSRDKQTFTDVGYNSRLDEVQASILRLLLAHLDDWSAGRREAALAYAGAGLGDHVGLPSVLEGADPAWHMYVVTHPEADALAAVAEASLGAGRDRQGGVHRSQSLSHNRAGFRRPAPHRHRRRHATIVMPINAKFSSRPELPWRMSRWVLSPARRLFSFTVSPTVFTHGSTPDLRYGKRILTGAYWRSICVVTVPAVCPRPPSARQRRKSAFASPTTPPTLSPLCGRWAFSGPASLVIR